MPRFAIGVTLTPHERVLRRRYAAAEGRQRPHQGESAALPLRSHTCSVTLPNLRPCSVIYTRYGVCSHKFSYEAPVQQKVWYAHGVTGGATGIEQIAQEMSALALAMAMTAEQKEMRRKCVPKGSVAPPRSESLLRSTTADACGGHYAACLKFSSGRLMPIGRPHDGPEQARADLYRRAEQTRLFPGQCLVLGICCRYLRMWLEPQFLPFAAPTIAAPETASQTAASAAVCGDDEEANEEDREEGEQEPWDEDAFVEEAE